MTQPGPNPVISNPLLAHPATRFASRTVASLFGVGFFPWASGTLASLLALAAGVFIMRDGAQAMPEATLAVTVLGLMATEHSGAATEDPKWIVIDEVAGQWLAMSTLTHATPIGLALAFVLFRVLDIWKPWPINVVDRQHNAGGVMGDDLVAGVLVAVLIWAVQSVLPHLLG